MRTMRIGVFCHRRDQTSLDLARRLNSLDQNCCITYDLDVGPGESIALTAQEIRWNDTDLSSLDIAWVAGYCYMDPVVPPVVGWVDWSRWQFDHLLEQQKYSAIESCLAELDRRGVPLVNPRRAALVQFAKADQLLRLGRAGCAIPRLLCSNDIAHVDAFCSRYEQVTWRPATGRAAWQRFTGKQKRHLVSAEKPPIILAEAVSDELILTWCFDGEPLLCIRIDPPASRPVETLGKPEDFGELLRFETLEMLTVADPRPLAGDLQRIAGASDGARWMVATFMPGTDGAMFVYDVDTDPDIAWLPARLRRWLRECVAHRLLNRSFDRKNSPEIGLCLQRPALFLRRMLQIQYEMEDSKYMAEDE